MNEAKPYKCSQCGFEKSIQTNHYGQCYSLGNYNCCPSCPPYKRPTTWIFAGELPKDAWVPEPWTTVKLSDVAEVKITKRKPK